MLSVIERIQRDTRATESEAVRLSVIIMSASGTYPYTMDDIFDLTTSMARNFQSFGDRTETPELNQGLVDSVLHMSLACKLDPVSLGLQVATMMITATAEQAEGD